jgi:small multidrug resistance pump
MPWFALIIAILAEVIGTSALRASDGFTKPIPSAIVVVGYGVAFYFLSLTLKEIPVGIAYAIWSGVGTVLITLAGVLLYKQHLDTPAVIGLCCILLGVVVINLYSKSIVH